jgi:hypothetical protein
MKINRQEIKSNAKESLKGNWSRNVATKSTESINKTMKQILKNTTSLAVVKISGTNITETI